MLENNTDYKLQTDAFAKVQVKNIETLTKLLSSQEALVDLLKCSNDQISEKLASLWPKDGRGCC